MTSLFDLCDKSVSDIEKPRLSRQCALILERLQKGSVTNFELAAMALKYTSRISDLRKAGYTIGIISRNQVTGETVYRLAVAND
jgi:hypothetical protein